ncbi:MAG TPA: DUF2270 domain-containing protein [Anaerolineae bacterium]|nr:DUF2270 domain-containing protein [Anaerolineae bacterium]HQK12896.1 DUF2270 domain-containing protein [Anaerolineae bacterium]
MDEDAFFSAKETVQPDPDSGKKQRKFDDPDCVWRYHGYRLDKGNFTTAMVHLYRAEITRVNLWRNRLDTTTNWSVVTTAGALTFGFSSTQNPHFVILLVLLLVLIFLNIEARRYAYYSLWYHRARLMETEFFAAMLAPPYEPAPDWGDALADVLRHPVFPISHWEAMGNRFRRNYAAIVTILIASWILKLAVHPAPASGVWELINRATIGQIIPGPVVITLVFSVYFMLFVMTLEGYRRYRKRGAPRRDEWQHRGPSWFKTGVTPNLAVIVTKQREQMAARLMTELGRGVTAMEGTGMYTGEERSVLLCAITDVQIPHLKTIVREVDKDGFVVVTQAREVRGGHFKTQEPPS